MSKNLMNMLLDELRTCLAFFANDCIYKYRFFINEIVYGLLTGSCLIFLFSCSSSEVKELMKQMLTRSTKTTVTFQIKAFKFADVLDVSVSCTIRVCPFGAGSECDGVSSNLAVRETRVNITLLLWSCTFVWLYEKNKK